MSGDARGRFSQAYIRLTEPIIFQKRARTLWVLFFMTLFMAWNAAHLKTDAGFEKQLPLGHPYIQIFKQYQQEFGGANTVLFALIQKEEGGDIYNADYMSTLRKLTDSVFFLPGIDRARVSSLFTPDVRYLEVVEEGFQGGNVIPADYQPTEEMLQRIRSNVSKAKIIGRLVANDQNGAMVFSELLEIDPLTGQKLDYVATAHLIEDVRQRYINPAMYEYRATRDVGSFKKGDLVTTGYSEPGRMMKLKNFAVPVTNADGISQLEYVRGWNLDVTKVENPDYNPKVDIHIVGFAKVVGDIADATLEVVSFFAITIFLIWLLLWWYTGSPLIALLPLSCGILAVVWELGILRLAGYGLDPFAILVPFLVLSISVSHGIQITSFWLYEVAEHKLGSFEASQATYRRLVIPGITALLTNVVGFGTILLIPIGIVQEMAINAMFGLVAIIVCKKILLPCLLTYAPVKDPEKFRQHQLSRDAIFTPVWRGISVITEPKVAGVVLVASAAVFGWSQWKGQELAIGELHNGVPELRPDSRYNLDSEKIVQEFAIGVDILKVIAENKADGCIDYPIMEEIDRFAWRMRNTAGVQSTLSLPEVAKVVFNAFNETNPKWQVLPRNSGALVVAVQQFPTSSGLLNKDCSAMPIFIFTADHKADTIDEIVRQVEQFRSEQDKDSPVTFKLATGNVGVMAAANDVIEVTEPRVLLWLFVFIALCVWASFRSLAGLICVLAPLALVSYLSYAVMVYLKIGMKVSTLPVAAFAAGIGVDYGIYIYSVLEECVGKGMTLRKAYEQTLHQTGKAVIVTALALGASVCTWMLSGLQFQVDMGILLTIMFIANAVAAVVLLPAFACFFVNREQLMADYSAGKITGH
ncbi:MAG TPA: MMPL family transporter [Nevskiaceae bacterium]|nr:MMPL family transporter [Nevskiaceae bacterium]